MSPRTVRLAGLADSVLTASPRLGRTRVLLVDGPAGSGKTTFAGRLQRAIENAGTSVELLHLDDVYEGWEGLDGVAARVESEILDPLAGGRGAEFSTWDWHAGQWGARRELPVAPVLLVEGCGAGDRLLASYAVLLVWVEAPSELRLARGIARDGEQLREQWLRWRQVETVHFTAEDTRRRAHLRVDGAAGAPNATGADVALLG